MAYKKRGKDKTVVITHLDLLVESPTHYIVNKYNSRHELLQAVWHFAEKYTQIPDTEVIHGTLYEDGERTPLTVIAARSPTFSLTCTYTGFNPN